ncbi:MAG: hypothetical protein Q7R41_11960, partial [Phycisphaerales bacterium]|nr:hypothetical protein [Phycisphaerales bacterium]
MHVNVVVAVEVAEALAGGGVPRRSKGRPVSPFKQDFVFEGLRLLYDPRPRFTDFLFGRRLGVLSIQSEH